MRQHQIEHDEVVARLLERTPRLPPIRDCGRREAVLLQVIAQHRADFTIIVDDEDIRFPIHAPDHCHRSIDCVSTTITRNVTVTCNRM